jgi:hypothetical protein
MELNPSWETTSRSATQEVPNILWNLKVHYRVRKNPPRIPTLSQADAVHITPFYFSKMHLNIILPPKFRSS